MTRPRWLTGAIAAVALCAGIAALHQPRPAIAAFLTFVAVTTAGARRLALVACALIAFGLIAAAPPLHPPRKPHLEKPDGHRATHTNHGRRGT